LALVVPIIILVSNTTRSTFGFGGGLMAMPLLAMVVDVRIATPLVALIANTDALAILLTEWRNVRLASAWRLVVASLLGVPLGLLFITGAYEGVAKLSLALVVIGFSLYNFLKHRHHALTGERTALIFGFFAGILGGAFNANGPLVVIYGKLRDWPTERFRATLQGYFFPVGLLTISSHAVAGLVTPTVLRLYLVSLPAVVLAFLIGRRLSRLLTAGKFDRLVYLLLMALGVTLLVQTL